MIICSLFDITYHRNILIKSAWIWNHQSPLNVGKTYPIMIIINMSGHICQAAKCESKTHIHTWTDRQEESMCSNTFIPSLHTFTWNEKLEGKSVFSMFQVSCVRHKTKITSIRGNFHNHPIVLSPTGLPLDCVSSTVKKGTVFTCQLLLPTWPTVLYRICLLELPQHLNFTLGHSTYWRV